MWLFCDSIGRVFSAKKYSDMDPRIIANRVKKYINLNLRIKANHKKSHTNTQLNNMVVRRRSFYCQLSSNYV